MTLRISGRRPLHTLPGQTTRPTSSRVRQAVFNILQAQVPGSRWLDLCAGCGSIGAEALLRECASVVGVERMPKAAEVVKHNWQQVIEPEQSMQVIVGDAAEVVVNLAAAGNLFDVIYCDPPYYSPIYAQVLPQIPPLLPAHGILIVEHHVRHDLGTNPGLSLVKQRCYGQTALSLFHLEISHSRENEES